MPEETNDSQPTFASEMLRPTRVTEISRLEISRLTIESGKSLVELFRESCRIVAETLKVARVGVWMKIENQSAFQCVVLNESSLQSPGESLGEGTVLQATDFPIYIQALNQRKIIPAEKAQHDPVTSELVEAFLRPMNIASTLDAPIVLAGVVSGVVCCGHIGAARE